jgi:hypothetical protein
LRQRASESPWEVFRLREPSFLAVLKTQCPFEFAYVTICPVERWLPHWGRICQTQRVGSCWRGPLKPANSRMRFLGTRQPNNSCDSQPNTRRLLPGLALRHRLSLPNSNNSRSPTQTRMKNNTAASVGSLPNLHRCLAAFV